MVRLFSSMLLALLAILCLPRQTEASGCLGPTCCLGDLVTPWSSTALAEVVEFSFERVRVRVLSDVAYCQGPVECPVADFPTELLWCPYPGCTRYQHPYEFCIEPIDVGDRIMWVVDLMTGCIQAAIPMDGEEVECSPSHVPVDFAMAHVLRPFAECHYYYQMAGWKSGECDEDTEGNDLDCADAVAGQGSGTGLVLVIGLILLTCRRRPPRRR